MKNAIEDDDVYWVMNWNQLNEDGTRKYPDKPEKEIVFEENMALAHLLMNEVVFINSHWWKKDWPEEAKNTFSINVNLGSVFAWGGSDAEEMFEDDLQEVYDHWKKDPVWGVSVWAIKKNNLMPQKPVYDVIQERGTWDLDSMNLKPNPSCSFWKEFNEKNENSKCLKMICKKFMIIGKSLIKSTRS